MKVFILLTLLSAVPLRAADAKPLTKIFSVSEDPGRGALELKIGEATETIELGADKGKYGVGIVLTEEVLPERYRKEFPKSQVIQIALGSLKAATEQVVPQFGSLSLVVSKIPTLRAIELPVYDATSGKKKPASSAMGLVYSPKLKLADSDEEKLKATFYLSEGQVEMIPLGEATEIKLKEGANEYPFKKQSFVLRLGTKLKNPFFTTAAELKGSVTVPVFWPNGPKSEGLARSLASESSEAKP